MFLSDRYHFEHNGTCDGVDPYASTSKVCSYQTDIILNTTVHVLQVLRFFPRRFLHVLSILLRCFLQVLRFLLRRFLHVMCFPAQMFSPCTVLSCSDVFSTYCSFLLRCVLHVLFFSAQMFSPGTPFPAQMFSPGIPILPPLKLITQI